MLKRFYIISLWIISGFYSTVTAQNDPAMSHYFEMKSMYNPATVGMDERLHVHLAYAHQLSGFEHHPRTMVACVDMPFYFLDGKHGVGVRLVNDRMGLFANQSLGAQYAYGFDLWGGRISAGCMIGVINQSFDGTKIDPGEAADPALPTTKVDGTVPDIGLGLAYACDKIHMGLAVSHLNGATVTLGDRNETKIIPHYYFMAGYNIKIKNTFLTIKSDVFVQTDLWVYRSDMTLRLHYEYEKRVLYGGVSYSPLRSITALVGGRIKGVMLGYSYEAFTSALSPAHGSHEISIGYSMEISHGRKSRNKHKSIRIL